jgi:HEAT repeat protein
VRFFAAKALLGLGKAAVERLIELAPGIQDNRLLDIFRILGDIGDPHAVPYLIRASKQSEYRGVAICALGKIGDVRAIPMLLNAVQDEHVVMIQEFTYQRSCENAAVWALGAIGDPQVVPALIDMIQNPKQWNVTDKNLVIEALGEIRDPRGLPIVITALEDCYSHHNPSGYSKIPAIEALAKIGGPSSVTALLKALQCENDYDVFEAILIALGKLPDHRAIRGIIESIRKEMSAWQAVQVLQSLLTTYPERLQTEDLEEVIGLKAKQAWRYRKVQRYQNSDDYTITLWPVTLELSQLKLVAHEELFRRVRH